VQDLTITPLLRRLKQVPSGKKITQDAENAV